MKPTTELAALPFDQRSVRYKPLAEAEEIEVSVKAVKNILAVKSRSGREPASADIWKFLMLCKSRQLNPFVSDAYLIGYDSKDGTKWNLITAIQALRKRAEANPQYRGTEKGVVVRAADGERVERQGTFVDDGEKLLGGWAKVYREDRTTPAYANVKLSTYDTGQSRWAKDAAGMIVKVAEAAALRETFPSDLGGLYVREEFDREIESRPAAENGGVAGLKDRLQLLARQSEPPEATTECVDPPHTDDELMQDVPSGSPSAPTPEELADQQREAKRELFEEGGPPYE